MIDRSIDMELDSGPRARAPERLCIATREVRPVGDLIRFVVGPDGAAIADIKHKLPGRGIWVTATHGALGEAIKRRAFARGFKREVRLPANLVERTEGLLEAAVLDALGIAVKAGLTVVGFTKSEAALGRGTAVALFHAAEAAPDGVRKLEAAMRRQPADRPVAVIGFLTAAQLDLAFSRSNVVHAALLAGRPSETFLARLRRLERFRTGVTTGDRTNQAGKAAAREPAADMDAYERDE
jgi:hypothetical protein